MDNSFFDKIVMWSIKDINRYNGIKIINYQDLDENYLRTVFNQLARICRINYSDNFMIEKSTIIIKTKEHNITIDKQAMVINHKNYTIVYSPNEDSLSFQIKNLNGHYVYNNNTLTYYDKESADYAMEYKKSNKKRKNILGVLNELNIEPNKSMKVNFNTLQLIRLLEIIKSNRKPDLIIEAENNNTNINDVRINQKNILLNTNAYIIKANDDGEMEEMMIKVTNIQNPINQIILCIYSIDSLGSYILIDKTTNNDKELDIAYQELINCIMQNDNNAELKDIPDKNYKIIYTNKTLQSNELLNTLTTYIPKETIEYISLTNEIIDSRYFRSENEEINRHNEARGLLIANYRSILELFQKKTFVLTKKAF